MNWKAPRWIVPFSSVCVVFAFLTAGWNGGLLVWPSMWIFVACLVAVNLDRLDKFKATTTGVEFEMKQAVAEAKNTVAEMQILAKQLAKISLSLVKRSARIGGFAPDQEELIKNDTIEMLRATGVAESDFPEVLDEWDRWVLADYVAGILGNSTTPQGGSPEVSDEWRELRRRGFSTDRPSADELRVWLLKHDFATKDSSGYLDDYAFYAEHGKHRRFEIWETHAEWPSLKKISSSTSPTGSVQKAPGHRPG